MNELIETGNEERTFTEEELETLRENLHQLVADCDPSSCILITFMQNHKGTHIYSYLTEDLKMALTKTAIGIETVNLQLAGILQFLSSAVGTAMLNKNKQN